jgi:hypothetical protein
MACQGVVWVGTGDECSCIIVEGSLTALRRTQLGELRNLANQVVAGGAFYELTKAPPLSLAIADADALKVCLEGFESEGDGYFRCPRASTSSAVVGPPFIEAREVRGRLGRYCGGGYRGERVYMRM